MSDLKYVELPAKEVARYRLNAGDIVFNRTNSKELVGKCEVFRESGDWLFASYLIRVAIDQGRALPEFIAAFLSAGAGRAQIDQLSRQIVGMSNINAQEIRSIKIPLPAKDSQAALVKDLQAARNARDAKLAQADALLASLDGFVLDALGLTAPAPHDPSKPFTVRLKSVRGSRLDPPAYTPLPIPSNPRRIPIEPLAKVAAIDANAAPRLADNDAIVPYVGLPECDLNDVREVATRTYAEAKGRSTARVGDILFARIEPSIFNKKYIFVEHLGGHDHVYLSTEFYAVRAHGDEHDQRYLYAMFQSAFVFNQVRGKTTGSSGRRRLDPEMFASLLVPWPDHDIRKKIAAEVSRRRDEARRLRDEARTIWDDGKRRFEEELLG